MISPSAFWTEVTWLALLYVYVVRYPSALMKAVKRLKTLCPSMGKVKIAQTLARAGQHLGPTTVGRILKEKSKPTPKLPVTSSTAARVVTSKYPNHVWNVDLTTVPVGAGFWCSWIPLALPRRWPFCWWVAVAVDHYSRRAMGTALFKKEPSSIQVRAFLGRTIADAGAKPKHLISDKGPQFWPCHGFKDWCDRRGIKPRFGAVGTHGSIAMVERFILTMKQLLAELPTIPLRRESFRGELHRITDWYNEHRPHRGLAGKGKTPNEVYENRFPQNRKPRIEPRERWPRGSPCAKPETLVAGKPGQQFEMTVRFQAKRHHLPILTLKRVA